MSYIDFLLSRFSCGSLMDPAPSVEVLQKILSTSMCAPDHGHLRPWRFIVINKMHRQELLDAIKKSMSMPEYNYPESYIPKVLHNFSAAPLVLALGMRSFTEKTSVSIDEQLMAASAAVMNILNAIHAMGFGAKWITGPIANKGIQDSLGFQSPYKMMGFLFIGTPCPGSEAPPRVAVDDYVEYWQGKPVKFKVDLDQ